MLHGEEFFGPNGKSNYDNRLNQLNSYFQQLKEALSLMYAVDDVYMHNKKVLAQAEQNVFLNKIGSRAFTPDSIEKLESFISIKEAEVKSIIAWQKENGKMADYQMLQLAKKRGEK